MNDFDEMPQEIPQLVLLDYGVDGTTFQITASIAKGTASDEPLRLAAPLLPSVEIVGPGGRIAWAARVPVTVRGGAPTGDTIEVGGDLPLVFGLEIPDDAFLGGFDAWMAIQALSTTSSTQLHVTVEDSGIARFRAAVAAEDAERDGRLVGSSWLPEPDPVA